MKMIGLSVPLIVTASMMLVSCAPVLDKNLMDEGSREVSFAALRESPGQYQGKIFILGGVIVRAKFTEEGTRIEAMHVPVDRDGEFEDSGRSEGRFMALMPKDVMMLDPLVYKKGRRITLAGEFVGTRSGRIDEMEYTYPLFRIKQIYLWPHKKRYDQPPHFYDPWFYPYPYYYRHPWWYYPHRHAPAPVHPPVPHSPPPAPRKDHERERGHDQK
jgi:outer membrane lipoprotein